MVSYFGVRTCESQLCLRLYGTALVVVHGPTAFYRSKQTATRTPVTQACLTLPNSAFAYFPPYHGIHTCDTPSSSSHPVSFLPPSACPSAHHLVCVGRALHRRYARRLRRRRVAAASHPQPAAWSALLTRRRCSRTPPPSSAPVGRWPAPARPPAPPPPAAAPLVRVRVRVRARV